MGKTKIIGKTKPETGQFGDIAALLEGMDEPEIVDGCNVRETAREMVDLDVEHSPVLQVPVCSERDLHIDVPRPVRVIREGSRYALVWPEQKDFQNVPEAVVKVMRARFLLTRGYYYKHFDQLPNSMQRAVVALFFGGKMWRPQAGSPLSQAMGLT